MELARVFPVAARNDLVAGDPRRRYKGTCVSHQPAGADWAESGYAQYPDSVLFLRVGSESVSGARNAIAYTHQLVAGGAFVPKNY